MRILFLGDSITVGVPGVSYVKMIQSDNKDWKIANRAKGGDTVKSLYKRVKEMDDLDSFDHIFLFIGVNDIYGKLTKTYRILKTLTKQRAAKNVELFTKQYTALVNHILSANRKLVIIPPLVIGEDYNSKWNTELFKLVESIKIIKDENKIDYIDSYTDFKKQLSTKTISSYLPLKISELLKDVKELNTIELVDFRSESRGLYLTLDGVHINSVGATIISKSIIEYVNGKNKKKLI